MHRQIAFVCALALAAVGLWSVPAGADPKSDFQVTLDCEGEIVEIAIAGNGTWTPAHDLESTLVGVPLAFGEQNGVFTPADGSDPVPFSEPPIAKKNVPQTRNIIVECSFSFSAEFPEGNVEGTGSVVLMVPRIH